MKPISKTYLEMVMKESLLDKWKNFYNKNLHAIYNWLVIILCIAIILFLQNKFH